MSSRERAERYSWSLVVQEPELIKCTVYPILGQVFIYIKVQSQEKIDQHSEFYNIVSSWTCSVIPNMDPESLSSLDLDCFRQAGVLPFQNPASQ